MSAMTLLSAGEAQRLTQRIKSTATGVRDGLFKLRNLVDEAKSSNAWQVLGFASWTAYLSDTLASEPMRLGREQRQELVEYLSGEGLSTRAIAPIVGVSDFTVREDQKAGARNLAAVPNGTPVKTAVSSETPLAPSSVVTEPRAVVGLDGKNYAAPAPRPVAIPVDHEQENAEQYSLEFGRALVTLLRFENPGYGVMLRAQWERGHVACPDGYIAVANPEGFRRLAAALTSLADEWTN
jgi:hypothetical protein